MSKDDDNKDDENKRIFQENFAIHHCYFQLRDSQRHEGANRFGSLDTE